MGTKDWGYILTGPGRPDRQTQVKVMSFSGVDTGDYGTMWEDKLTARPTRPLSVLVQRGFLISAVGAGDRVHFATLLCMGVSGQDVGWLVKRLGELGATVMVHDGLHMLAPGEDPAVLIDAFERTRIALHTRRSRAKKAAKTRKRKS